MVKSNTAGNIKGVLRQSSIGRGISHSNGKKVGLSQFSGTGSGYSPMKSKPQTTGEGR